jgi:3-methylcrotonyl-CoA carboxylase alpha subunit
MFTKILIANRGEIAVRVIRTARRMGIRTVAVYSEADAKALHVEMADEAVLIGEAAPSKSYLLIERIIEAALLTGAEAIHPGYGFLSENAAFCAACERHGVVFIGPPASAIKAMGSKSAAKTLMEKAEVPLVPGYHGDDQTASTLESAAKQIGYPVLLKATAGGGGKGMRAVEDPQGFTEALETAKREAQSSFGDDRMLVERLVLQPRHVEIQVFCDQQGNAVYLFERDCSIQRRHQKIIEEAPAPSISPELRRQLGEAAINAALAINYVGAGTVEFLLDVNHQFYFMEMNTRLQVEHPVTEMITGQDLVEWQLMVANGEALPLAQDELTIHGHAFEARIYAEDPDNDYLPAAGVIDHLSEPQTSEFVRVDTGVLCGDEIGVYYDPMIAKLIVWGRDRDEALSRMSIALSEYHVGGVTTNIPFLRRLVASKPFRAAEIETGFLHNNRDLLSQTVENLDQYLALAFLFLVLRKSTSSSGSPWETSDAWRLNADFTYQFVLFADGGEHVVSGFRQRQGLFELSIGDKVLSATASYSENSLRAEIDGHRISASVFPHKDGYYLVDLQASFYFSQPQSIDYDGAGVSVGSFAAPMNGTIVDIVKAAGEAVEAGDSIVIMEAMKMEHVIRAHTKGMVKEVFFAVGDLVSGGDPLIEFEAQQENEEDKEVS